MTEKQNDYFLNLLNNPTFTADDFTLVGLSVDNTSLLDKNDYLNSNYIRRLDVFKTNGVFDEAKFNNFYDYVKSSYLDLAKIKEADDLGRTWMAYRNDFSMPEYLRDKSPQFKIEKVLNPMRLQEGFVTFGLKENPTRSDREIAQSQSLYNTKTGQWEKSPNDVGILGFFDNLIDPKVLATWDFDADINGNPTSDKDKIVYHKGEKKLNYNGTYYYETLGNRDIYGKDVLSTFDVLTTDGSVMNSIDFLDSDDIEKSPFGSMMRAAVQIIPAFIPGLDAWYLGTRVALGVTEFLPVIGKMIGGMTGADMKGSFLSKIEAFDKALSFSLSDYVRGSDTLDSHFWSAETAFKLIADVFTQLGEQRWLFEKGSSLFSGLSKEVLTSEEAQIKWIENYLAKSLQNKNLAEILKGLAEDEKDVLLKLSVEWSRAQKVLLSKLKGAQQLSGKLSMAYMTGITTASSYGEMKEQGATDLEAALFTLGYSLAEFGLLNTEMGRWILPELKLERSHINKAVETMMSETKSLKDEVKTALKEMRKISGTTDTTTEAGKLNIISKFFNIGKKAAYNRLGDGVGKTVAGAIISNMGAEAMEETSEELLLDLSKTFYNIGASFMGGNFLFKDAFKNVFDRYAMSFLGGALGGGIAGVQSGVYRAALLDRSMTQELAAREVVNLVHEGKGKELIKMVNKGTWGSANLDEAGNPVDDYKKSLDFNIKANFARLVNNIQDILTENGATLSKSELIEELGPKEIRLGQLASIAAHKSNSINYYLNEYNRLSKEVVLASLELLGLERAKTDEKEREERREGKTDSARITELKELIKKNLEELVKYRDGTKSDEFILDAVFEMVTRISSPYITNYEQWAEDKYGKPIDLFTQEERTKSSQEFRKLLPVYRDLIHKYRQLHIQNMEALSKMIEEYDLTYFKDDNEAIKNLNDILFSNREYVNNFSEGPVVSYTQNLIALNQKNINTFLLDFLRAILESLDTSMAEPYLKRLKTITDKETNILKLAGIPTGINSIQELLALTSEQKDNLALALGFDTGGDSLISIFTKMGEDNNPLLDEENLPLFDNELFKGYVALESLRLQLQQATEFNLLFLDFLKIKENRKAIVEKLKSAKYMVPSVKIALDNFFTNGLQIETDEGDLKKLEDYEIEEYLNAYKDVPSSPASLFLLNIKRTFLSKGIDIAPTITDLDSLVFRLAKAKNLESFNISPEIELQIKDALTLISMAYSVLDSAATHISGDLSDVTGFNALINNIREKRKKNRKEGSESNTTLNNDQKLVLIGADIAEGIKMDVKRYELSLRYFLTLFNHNSNAVLNEHDKTLTTLFINLYKKLTDFVSVEIPDWEDLSKLKNLLESSEIKDVVDSITNGENDRSIEFKIKVTKARAAIDRTLHEIFKENEDKPLENLISKIDISKTTVIDDYYTSLDANEETLSDKDFLWYLAEIAAADPDILMNEYLYVINETYAPVIGQEEAIRKILAFLVNPLTFKKFAQTWNKQILDKHYETEAKLTDEVALNKLQRETSEKLINVFRAIFVEGMPGTGKSSAIIYTVRNILQEFHPKILEKVVVVSNSEKNALTLVENTGTNKDQYFGIEEFRSKIMNNYIPPTILEDGELLFLLEDVEDDAERNAKKYAKATLNSEAIDASFLILDEATSLSQMDALMVDDWMESKNIFAIFAGDFDLLGTSGLIMKEGKPVSISLDGTNYISTHKLGQIIRGNNKSKTDNIVTLKYNRLEFINSLLEKGKISPITFNYYLDESGLYGDVLMKPDQEVTASGSTNIIDENTKNIITSMIDSLNPEEKINYIFDSPDSLLYKYLEANYADKINKLSTNASQSQEGQYYIVDIALEENLSNTSVQSLIAAGNYFKMFYTAISRAKLGTLIFDRTGVIDKRINSIRLDKLVKTIISQESKKNYALQRKEAILAAIKEGTATLFETLSWEKEPKAKKVEAPEKEHEEEEGTNESYVPDIKNKTDGVLNMMIHTFNSHEIGGFIDENGELELGEHHENRTDNAHGVIKLLNSLKDDDGTPLFEKIDVSLKISKENTAKIREFVDEIRTIATYGTSIEDIIGDINIAFKNIFGLNIDLNIEAVFNYMNSSENGTLKTKRTKFYKFFRGAKDYLLYLFTKETDKTKLRKQETPNHRTLGIEVFINKLQIVIPIGTLTNPATLLKAEGFEDLKAIYDSVRGDVNLGNFTAELLKQKLAGNKILHLDEMLNYLEVYSWNYNHPNHKNTAIRFDKDFVLNKGGNKATGILVPPTGPRNPKGARGEGYLDEGYYYPGRPVTLEEYRREMPNRKISQVFEGINGDFIHNGTVYIKKGMPFVLMSDIYKHASDQELYEAYIDLVINNKQKNVTRVYVNFPKKGLDYFLWNQQEAYKREGNATKAKNIDYSVGNKLTSFRLLSFMLQKDSSFLKAYNKFFDSIINDSRFNKAKIEDAKTYTLKRIERLLQIMTLLINYENSLKDITKAVTMESESGLESKVVDIITKKKLFLDFLDLNIENLKTTNLELYKLFIPDNALNPHTTEPKEAIIGNSNYSLRTALLFEFRRLLLGNYILEDGSGTAFPIDVHVLESPEIKRNSEEFIYLDYQLERINALKEDIAKNKWDGVLTKTNLRRNSEIAVSVGPTSYKIVEIQTEDESYVSAESFTFNGKLPTTALILDVAPILNDILSKLVVVEEGIYDTSTKIAHLSNEEKKQIYLENLGAFLEGRAPSKVRGRKVQAEPIKNKLLLAIQSDENYKHILDIINKYLLKNTSHDSESVETLLQTIFSDSNLKDKYGVLKIGSNFKIVRLTNRNLTIIAREATRFFVLNKGNGDILEITSADPDSAEEALYQDLISRTDIAPAIIEKYKENLILKANPKFKVGDNIITNEAIPRIGTITAIDINPTDNTIEYLINFDDEVVKISQETAENNYTTLATDKEISGLEMFDNIFGKDVIDFRQISEYYTNPDNRELLKEDLVIFIKEGTLYVSPLRLFYYFLIDTFESPENIEETYELYNRSLILSQTSKSSKSMAEMMEIINSYLLAKGLSTLDEGQFKEIYNIISKTIQDSFEDSEDIIKGCKFPISRI